MDPVALNTTQTAGALARPGRVVAYGGSYEQALAARRSSFAAELTAFETEDNERQAPAVSAKTISAADPRQITNGGSDGIREGFGIDNLDRLPPNPVTAGAGNELFGKDGFFDVVLDIVNPLQHIPVVSTIYRRLTGDELSAGARIAGDFLFGGPIGLASGVVNAIVEASTGRDVGDNVLAALGLADELRTQKDEKGAIAVAGNGSDNRAIPNDAPAMQVAAEIAAPPVATTVAPAKQVPDTRTLAETKTLAQIFAEPTNNEPAGFIPLNKSEFMPLAREPEPMPLQSPQQNAAARGAIEGRQWFPLNGPGSAAINRPVGIQQVGRPNGSGTSIADGRGWPGGVPAGLNGADANQQIMAERALLAYQRSLEAGGMGAIGPMAGMGPLAGMGAIGSMTGGAARGSNRVDLRN